MPNLFLVKVDGKWLTDFDRQGFVCNGQQRGILTREDAQLFFELWGEGRDVKLFERENSPQSLACVYPNPQFAPL